jgi:hypothetical protein
MVIYSLFLDEKEAYGKEGRLHATTMEHHAYRVS